MPFKVWIARNSSDTNRRRFSVSSARLFQVERELIARSPAVRAQGAQGAAQQLPEVRPANSLRAAVRVAWVVACQIDVRRIHCGLAGRCMLQLVGRAAM